MAIPNLTNERLEQMIHLATSYKQETITLLWHQRLWGNFHARSSRLIYGLGATAVSFSCVAAFWLVPMMTTQTEIAASDFSTSEYMMQDLLEDLSQTALSPDLNFEA